MSYTADVACQQFNIVGAGEEIQVVQIFAKVLLVLERLFSLRMIPNQ